MIDNYKKGSKNRKIVSNKDLNDLYKDLWNEIIQFFSLKEDFFNSALISKEIRNEIISKSPYTITCKNIIFKLEKDVDISNFTFIHNLVIEKKDFLVDDKKYFPIGVKSLKVYKCSGFIGDKLCSLHVSPIKPGQLCTSKLLIPVVYHTKIYRGNKLYNGDYKEL